MVEDIGDVEAIDRIFRRIEADERPLKGIVHSAFTLADGSIERQTPASIAAVFAPKAGGAWHMHERSRAHELDFFLLYSSAASVLGTPGQANYAAANSFVDALAHMRRAQGQTATSINWGLWEVTGANVKHDLLETWQTQGAIPITVEQGLAALDKIIRSSEAQVAVLPFDWKAARTGKRRFAALLRNIPEVAQATAQSPLPLAAVYEARLAQAPAAERHDVLVEFVRQRVGQLLKLDPAVSLPDNAALLEIGLDSLVGLQLRNDLEKLMGKPVPSTLFFDCPTLGDVATYLALTLQPARALSDNVEREQVVL